MHASLAIHAQKWLFSAIVLLPVSLGETHVSQQKDVQTKTWAMSRDIAFILFSLPPLSEPTSAQIVSRDATP